MCYFDLQEVLILLAEIADVDRNMGTLEREVIMSSRSIAMISHPLVPYTTFSPTQTYFGPNSQTLKFQYRVLGTYGFNCTNCQHFPSCVPVTCKGSPCHNGETCSEVGRSSYLQSKNLPRGCMLIATGSFSELAS